MTHLKAPSIPADSKAPASVLRRAKPALGTIVTIAIGGLPQDEALALTESAFGELYRLEKCFNRFDDESELSRLNRAPLGRPQAVSSDLRSLLTLAAAVEAASDGAFRAVPEGAVASWTLDGQGVTRQSAEAFDLGGIAKGYIVDRVFEWCLPRAASVTVNAGGDLRTTDSAPVELRAPHAQCYRLTLRGGALATSIAKDQPLAGTPCARYPLATPDVHDSLATPGDSSATPGVRHPLGTPGVRHPLGTPGVRHPLGTPGVRHPLGTPGVRHPLGTPGVRHPLGTPGVRHPRPALCAGASVVADSCALADAFTKVALFGDWRAAWERLPGLRALCLFGDNGEILTSR